jgi:tetrahydromethanopterin S-methyltransferase subunit G
MRIEDRVDDVDARLKRVAAEVQGLMGMPGIYGAEYGKIRTALEGHDKRFDHVDDTLQGHGEKLGEHDRRFDHLEELISDQGQELREHTRRFDRIEGTLAGVNQELVGHRELLEQILAKVA